MQGFPCQQMIVDAQLHVRRVENIALDEKRLPAPNQIKFSLIKFSCTCMALICVRIALWERVSCCRVFCLFSSMSIDQHCQERTTMIEHSRKKNKLIIFESKTNGQTLDDIYCLLQFTTINLDESQSENVQNLKKKNIK